MSNRVLLICLIHSLWLIFLVGCCKTEYDSTYPIQLNGIISPDEFAHSIARINRINTSKKWSITHLSVLVISMVLGTIFIVLGGVTWSESDKSVSTPFFIAGATVLCLTPITWSIVYIVIECRRALHQRQAVAEESMRYSTRSPIPCSWRLQEIMNAVMVSHLRDIFDLPHYFYQIVIDIGRPTAMGDKIRYINQGVNESRAFSKPPKDFAPPSYTIQVA